MLSMFVYACLYVYYKFFGHDPLKKSILHQVKITLLREWKFFIKIQIQRDDEKSISITGEIREDENSSHGI